MDVDVDAEAGSDARKFLTGPEIPISFGLTAEEEEEVLGPRCDQLSVVLSHEVLR